MNSQNVRIAFVIFRILSLNKDPDEMKCIRSSIDKLFTLMTFAVFIRFFMETFLLIWVATFSEISYIRAGIADKLPSIILWFFWVGVIVVIVLVALVQWIRFTKNGNAQSRYCSECFEGLGVKSVDKTQMVLFYLRRLALVASGERILSLTI